MMPPQPFRELNPPGRRQPWLARRLLLLALLAALVWPVPAQAGRDEPREAANGPDAALTPLLPDLRTVPPEDLSIEYARGGRRLLRLANLVWNSGAGALELTGALNPSTQQTIVVQHLSVPDSDQAQAYVVGEFVYHPTHAHFHFEDFAVYQIWSLTPEGELHQLMATGGKLSYCLMETDVIDRDNPSFTRLRAHTDCGQETQGILPGWGDRYNAELDGQTVDITNLPIGRYALLSTANPTGALLESDYTNNTGVTIINLRASRVDILSQPHRVPENCRATGRC